MRDPMSAGLALLNFVTGDAAKALIEFLRSGWARYASNALANADTRKRHCRADPIIQLNIENPLQTILRAVRPDFAARIRHVQRDKFLERCCSCYELMA
jgi:hypothetical protein